MTDGRMMSVTARKVKISVSIDAALLANVDRYAATHGVTRSAALERWLAQVSHRERLSRLEEETAAYYDALTDDDRAEDAALAASSAKAFRKVHVDAGWPEAPPAPKRPRRRGAS
jgi:metal-responsive CopG/Arc/MetJ family transcriptional regulator